jgi:HSP20 family protein
MEERQMALLSDPFNAMSSFEQALDAYRTSNWLEASLSGGGAYPPVNVFRKGDDFIIIVELPGVKKSDLDVQGKAAPSDCTAKKQLAIRRRRRCIAASGSLGASTGR